MGATPVSVDITAEEVVGDTAGTATDTPSPSVVDGSNVGVMSAWPYGDVSIDAAGNKIILVFSEPVQAASTEYTRRLHLHGDRSQSLRYSSNDYDTSLV